MGYQRTKGDSEVRRMSFLFSQDWVYANDSLANGFSPSRNSLGVNPPVIMAVLRSPPSLSVAESGWPALGFDSDQVG